MGPVIGLVLPQILKVLKVLKVRQVMWVPKVIQEIRVLKEPQVMSQEDKDLKDRQGLKVFKEMWVLKET
jgi:hypothetical protein